MLFILHISIISYFKRLSIKPSNKLRARDLRGKKKEELTKQLDELKGELASLRVAKVTGGAPQKLSKMYVTNPFFLAI